MRILFITPWYPTPNDSMSGLFVKKIVTAVTHDDIETRVIYDTDFPKLLLSLRKTLRHWGTPDLIHLHVVTKQALLPLILKRLFHTPYILTEHWSGYLPENGDYLRRCNRPLLGSLYRRFTRRVVANASAVTAVSTLLRDNMRRCGLDNPDFRVIYNVVDPIFTSQPSTLNPQSSIVNHPSSIVNHPSPIVHPSSFIHVSCFDNRAKNVIGIIRAASLLRDRGFSFRLTMVGEGHDYEECRNLASSLNLNDFVTFTGTLQSPDVARLMSQNNCFILFSNYETAAVVLEEALTIGMNIISTPVGIAPDFPDRITLVEKGNILALADAMQNIPNTPSSRISFSDIPNQYISLYRSLVNPFSQESPIS